VPDAGSHVRVRTNAIASSVAGYRALDVAVFILHRTDREGGADVTPLKLQKLLYYAQAWSLALDDRPLFVDTIEAWEHGPVVPAVYHRFSSYGWRPIDPPAPAEIPDLDERARVRVERVLSVYGELSGTQLERMSHSEAPWREARHGAAEPLERGGDAPHASGSPVREHRPVISHASMAAYYRSAASSDHD
jgi:uncharacterized phage-associated protein